MSTVILDIETVSLVTMENVTEGIGQSLIKNCKTPEEVEAKVGECALSPLTGFVCCVGMYNPDTKKGPTFCVDMDERTILTMTWAALLPFKRIVTFNGRGFDIPFLLTRSAILGVQISRHDLMGNRYTSWPHCDLMDQLSHYGATKRQSLDMYCKAFGIKSSKAGGMDGSKVGEAYHEGRHQEIAEYCAADCVATAALYDIWIKRLQK